MNSQLAAWLVGLGLNQKLALAITISSGVVLLLALAWLANLVARRLLLRLLRYFITRSETRWDDYLLERNVFARLANLAPALVIYLLEPLYFSDTRLAAVIVQKLTSIFMLVVGALVLEAVLSAANDIYGTFETSKHVPLKSFFQVIKVIGFLITGIVVLAIVLDKTPLYLLSGLGALTAVLLIVFKDPILGFVAGIQLAANRMVAIGDWIAMPSHNADGDVIEVALTTVKVRNWDKTITTIPTYDLITSSFKNYRGMKESGGRRIMRAINIDLNTVRFCDAELLGRLDRVQLIRDYLARKQAEVAQHNADHEVDDASPVNGRRLTNLGTFRAYVEAYLRNNPLIRKDMTFLIRQKEPTPQGVPIEVYVFTDTTVWAEYEAIQADVFDHLYAVVPQFDLRVFQEPTGVDFRAGLEQRPTAVQPRG